MEIFSTTPGGGYRIGHGTSYAAPFVTAVATLVREAFPSLSAEAVKERLLNSTEVIDYYEKERLVSAGRLNAYHALKGIFPARPRPPQHFETVASSYSTSHPYANKTSEKRVFRKPGARFLRVHFSKFDTEVGCDFATIRDGTGRVVLRYSGQKGSFWSAEVIGDTLEIEFETDYSMPGYGFDVDAMGFSFEGDLSYRRRDRERLARPWWTTEPRLLDRWTEWGLAIPSERFLQRSVPFLN